MHATSDAGGPSGGWKGRDLRDMLARSAVAIGAGTPTDVGRSWTLATEHPDLIALTGGIPDGATLPAADLRDAIDHVLATEPEAALEYGGRVGFEGLREALAERQGRVEGMRLSASGFLVTNGSSGAIETVCKAFLEPGDVVITERPSFSGSVRTMVGHQAEIADVPMDEEGISLDGVADVIRRAGADGKRVKLLYTIADFHNPTGATMTAARRAALVELCARHRVLIVEDSAYADISFTDSQPPSLYAAAGGEGVLRLGTFSKTIATGLRVGWVQASEEVVNALEHVRFDMGASPLLHRALAEYMALGKLDAHVARMRPLYGEKCRVLTNAVAEHCGPYARFQEPDGGFFLWVECVGADAGHVAGEAAREGLIFPLGSVFYRDGGDDTSHLRLAFSNASPTQLGEAGRRLGVAMRRAAGV